MTISRIEVLERIPEDPLLRRTWNDLALSLEHPQVFYTYEWAIAVQRAYSASLSPLLFTAYDGESLAGLVALARRPSGEIAFLTADTGDYCDFLANAARNEEFVAAVFAELRKRQVTKVVLTNLPADSRSINSLRRAATESRYRVHLRSAYHCAQVHLGTGEEREAVKKTVLAKKRLRRNMREMGKIGTVRLDHATEWKQIEDILPGFQQTHIVRFLENEKVSSMVRQDRRMFVSELARELSANGWIALSRLLVSEDTVAWNYGFRFAGSWFWYQPTLNREYGDFSPGYCLLAKIIEQACDTPTMHVVDLGLGAEGYKDRFTTATRETLYCELNASVSNHVKTATRSRVVRAMERSPAVERHMRGLLSHFTSFRSRIKDAGWKTTFGWTLCRLTYSIAASENVLFFQWPENPPARTAWEHKLVPLDAGLIAEFAMQYSDDAEALRYLMRCAQRVEQGGPSEGYALIAHAREPVHILWVRDFEGFSMAELNRRLQAPCPDAVMIFDCFTPRAARGNGYFSEAIDLVSRELRSRGKSAWIFGAESNRASVQGIERSAFQYRFSLGSRRIAFFTRNRDSVPEHSPVQSDTSVPAA